MLSTVGALRRQTLSLNRIGDFQTNSVPIRWTSDTRSRWQALREWMFGQTKIVLSENARQRRGAEKKRAKGLSTHQERHCHERCDTSGQECLQVSRPLCKRLDVL